MRRKHIKQSDHGFTLVELMIVIAVIAILSAIALPSYLKSVRTSRRSDAVAGLSQDQGIMERCYAAQFDYTQVNTAPAPNGCVAIVTTSPNGYYTIALTTVTSTTYKLTATATGAQAADTACAQMSIDNTNNPTAVNSAGAAVNPPSTCWSP